jgi:hypothetical protein
MDIVLTKTVTFSYHLVVGSMFSVSQDSQGARVCINRVRMFIIHQGGPNYGPSDHGSLA